MAIVDFWLPDGAALPLLRQLRQRCAEARLLVLSGDEDVGAHGFLCKHEPPEAFAQAVAALLAGGDWFAAVRQRALPPAPRRELPVQAHELGPTERQGQRS